MKSSVIRTKNVLTKTIYGKSKSALFTGVKMSIITHVGRGTMEMHNYKNSF